MLDQNFFEEKFARFSPLYKLPDKLMSRWICLDFVIVLWNLGTSASLRQSEVKEIIIGHVELTLIFLFNAKSHLESLKVFLGQKNENLSDDVLQSPWYDSKRTQGK